MTCDELAAATTRPDRREIEIQLKFLETTSRRGGRIAAAILAVIGTGLADSVRAQGLS
jgi:hypothetical protein